MKRFTQLFAVILVLGISALALAQGRIQGKLQVGVTPLDHGDIRIVEPLSTRDGVTLPPGTYRIAISLNSLGEAYFVLDAGDSQANKQQEQGTTPKNPINKQRELPRETVIRASITRNTLVTGIASIDGDFSVQGLTPTEAVLSFNSKQFAANVVLGRSVTNKSMDLVPVNVALDQVTPCGQGCAEAFVKVTVRNEGNSTATGKWNVVLMDPKFYVGVASDVPASGEKVVVSQTKVKLPCCGTTSIHAEVHPDFYNKNAMDANENNNSRNFSLNIQPK